MGRRKHRRTKRNRKKPWLAADAVVWSRRAKGKCMECKQRFLGKHALKVPCGKRVKGPAVCLECAGLDMLAFVPAGNAKLTRRASKYSARRAVVVRGRGKFTQRFGILVEATAVVRACDECGIEVPSECFKGIAGTTTVLAPHMRLGPIKERVFKSKGRAPRSRDKLAPNPKRRSKVASRGAAKPRVSSPKEVARVSGELTVEGIRALILNAYPNCSHSRATKVARYSLGLPEARQVLATRAQDVGILVSKYLRRRRG